LDRRFIPQYAAAEGTSEARERASIAVDDAIRQVKKADWRGNRFKEREVRNAIQAVLGGDYKLVERIFEIVKAQREY
jgi:type I restriction enzyme R subunit